MKKVLFAISGILSVAYVAFFCLNVSDLVTQHLEHEISYPLYVLLFSVLLFVVMLIINKVKRFDKKVCKRRCFFYDNILLKKELTFCPY